MLKYEKDIQRCSGALHSHKRLSYISCHEHIRGIERNILAPTQKGEIQVTNEHTYENKNYVV